MKACSKSNYLVAAAVLIAVAALVCAFTYPFHVSNTVAKEDSLVGEWILVEHYEYSDTGKYSYYVADVASASKDRFVVSDAENGMFRGVYKDTAVSGAYLGGVFSADVIVGSEDIHIYGNVDNEIQIHLSVSSCSDGKTASYMSIYTKTGFMPFFKDYHKDISGEWTMDSIVSDGATYDGFELTVYGQKNCVFYGMIKTTVGDVETPLSFSGVLTMKENAPLVTGTMIDINGGYWTVMTTKGLLVIMNTSLSESSVVLSTQVTFTRDGGDVRTYVPENLNGREWYGLSLYNDDISMKYPEFIVPYSLEITSQKDYLIKGIIHADKDYKFSGYQFLKSPSLAYISYYDGENIVSYTLQLTKESKAVLSKTTSSDPTSLILVDKSDRLLYKSYWYDVMCEGYDSAGAHIDSSANDVTPDFNMEVVSVNGSNVTGYFMGHDYSGTYSDGTLSFKINSADFKALFVGKIADNGTMVASVLVDEKKSISSWSCVLSQQFAYSAITADVPDLGTVGTWATTDESSIIVQSVTITEAEDLVSKGTIGLTSGSTVQIRCSVTGYEVLSDEILVKGIAVNSYGMFYTFVMSNGMIAILEA